MGGVIGDNHSGFRGGLYVDVLKSSAARHYRFEIWGGREKITIDRTEVDYKYFSVAYGFFQAFRHADFFPFPRFNRFDHVSHVSAIFFSKKQDFKGVAAFEGWSDSALHHFRGDICITHAHYFHETNILLRRKSQ